MSACAMLLYCTVRMFNTSSWESPFLTRVIILIGISFVFMAVYSVFATLVDSEHSPLWKARPYVLIVLTSIVVYCSAAASLVLLYRVP